MQATFGKQVLLYIRQAGFIIYSVIIALNISHQKKFGARYRAYYLQFRKKTHRTCR